MKSLHNLSYKTLFTILFFALAGIVFFLKIGGKTQKVSASWWDDSWHYRQAINISSHNSLESNVYIATSVNIGTTAKAQIDDGDFRFISQSGENLSYYIVSGAGTTNVSFHILIPSFPSGTSTIYAYYGNTTADNGFSGSDFSTEASNYTIGSLSSEEAGGGPIAYWKFDEGVGTTAHDSSNLNHGVLSGTTLPEWQSEENCISGKCLYFNGTTASVTLNSLPSIETPYTISLWIKPQKISAGQSLISLNGVDTYPFFLINSNNKLLAYCGNEKYRYGSKIFGSSDLNQWYFVTFVVENSSSLANWKVYVNGKDDTGVSGANTGTYVNPSTSGTIGKRYNGGYFQGYIDDVKIYPYARSAAQIKQDYNSRGSLSGSSANLGVQSSTAPDLNSSLFSHWKFNNSLYNSVSTGSTAIAPLSGTPNYTSAGKDKQGLDFTQLYTGNFTYVSSNTFEDTTKNWTTNELVGYQFAADYTPNSQYCQGTITSNTSTTITFSGSCSSWVGNKYYRIKKSIYISAPLTGHSTNAITASLWFKSNGSQGNRIARMSNEAFNFTINGNNISTGINTYGSHITYTTNNVNDQKWHYMAITYDGSTEKLFYDGVAVGLYSTATTVISNGSLTLGSRNDGMQEFFNGSIDEVKIYNKALTPDEIKQDYNGSSAIQFGSTNQTIGGTTTSLDYCIPGDTSYCAPPVAEWKMDEGVGTSIIDTSGNSNTGTFGAGSSAPTWAQGKIGKSISFDGSNDYIDAGTSPNFNLTNSITVETWIKSNNITGWQVPIGKGYDTTYAIKGQQGQQAWDVFFTTAGRQRVYFPTLTNNIWYHLTGTFDGRYQRAYLNGILIGTNDLTNDTIISSPTTRLLIGSPDRTQQYFNGLIDHVKIYNYARTPAQVAYDYNRGGPVGWWKMDECQGSTIYDWSGNGNNGTLTIGSNGTQNSIGTCQIGTSAAWTNGATGKFNSSLNLDGTDDSVLLSSTLPVNTGDFTISLWTKISSTQPAGTTWHILASNKNAPAASAGFGIVWNSSENKFLWSTANGSTSSEIRSQHTWESILDKWAHIVMVRKSGATNNGNFYINGIYEPLSSSGAILNVGTSNFMRFGTNSSPYTSYYFQGQIDDVRIYNYALTPEQIKQVYNGGAVNFN